MNEVVRYRTAGGGAVVGIVRTAGTRKPRLEFIALDGAGLRVQRLPLDERRHMTAIEYPLYLCVRKLRQAGRLFGITKAARAMLREVTR